LALSKTAISADGPRRTGLDVWGEWNMRGRKRAICVRGCVTRTYVSDRAAEIVRVLTKNGNPPSPAYSAVAAWAAKAGRLWRASGDRS